VSVVAAAVIGSAVVGYAASSQASASAEDAANNATNAQSASAAESAALGRERLAFEKQQYADNKVYRDKANQTALDVSGQQLASSKLQDQLAQEYNTYRKTVFQPLETQLVNEATAYDTPERRGTAANEAMADVNAGFAGVHDANGRRLQSMGINPGSARAIAAMGGSGIEQAKANAGASYSARRGVESTGTAMKLNAASLGRNLPANQNASANTAINAGNSAVSNAVTPVNVQNASTAPLGSAYAGAIGANNSAAAIYGNVANTYQRQADNSAAAWAALGSSAGNAISTYYSDETLKEGVQPVDEDEALEAVNATPVKKWRYSPSKMAARGLPMDDGEQHIGPMAQDVNETMGEEAAPGGKKIDPITMGGVTMRAVQAVDKKVDRVAKQVATIASLVRGGMEVKAA